MRGCQTSSSFQHASNYLANGYHITSLHYSYRYAAYYLAVVVVQRIDRWFYTGGLHVSKPTKPGNVRGRTLMSESSTGASPTGRRARDTSTHLVRASCVPSWSVSCFRRSGRTPPWRGDPPSWPPVVVDGGLGEYAASVGEYAAWIRGLID